MPTEALAKVLKKVVQEAKDLAVKEYKEELLKKLPIYSICSRHQEYDHHCDICNTMAEKQEALEEITKLIHD